MNDIIIQILPSFVGCLVGTFCGVVVVVMATTEKKKKTVKVDYLVMNEEITSFINKNKGKKEKQY